MMRHFLFDLIYKNMTNELIWFISITLTVLIWGTWLIFSRKEAQELSNPFLENIFITIWALICNTLIFLFYVLYHGVSINISLFLLPFLSGILWACAWLFAFISISKIWVGKAMSIWAPSWMLVSFLWWVLYYNEFDWSIFYASIAVAIIIVWVISVLSIFCIFIESHMGLNISSSNKRAFYSNITIYLTFPIEYMNVLLSYKYIFMEK